MNLLDVGDQQPPPQQENLFDDFNADNNDEDNGNEAGWADAFVNDDSDEKYTLGFSRSATTEVLNQNTVGNKQKKSGLSVNAAFFFNTDEQKLQLELQFTN